ncbi:MULTISPECIES: PilX N-terminal domain-containing pilus assembly protein [unclassified Thioalkalivibrio]|uniref:pilus assembly PilX family protein n=1 Tax=unclassified Thioalkalivibrio TaxID=2621013 RepID=UPI000381E4F8|nr:MULTISPECIES: PilX N-terminal domain-containing pilus assembly protein [unclassified Thioalkalivibrio]
MYATRANHHRIGHRMDGVASLLIALIIMVAVTITIIFAAQTSILEQRMSGNEIRAKQTAAAAQSGLETAMDHIRRGNYDPSSVNDNANGPYRVAYYSLDDAPTGCSNTAAGFVAPTLPTDFDNREFVVMACGWSDDESASQAVLITMKAGPSLGNPPNNPIITRGGVDIRGNAEVFNAYNNLTIRTGSAVDISGNAGTTFMRQLTEQPPALDDPVPGPGSSIYREMSNKDRIGVDVLDYDPSMNIPDDEFFERFMGAPREEYRDNLVTHHFEEGEFPGNLGPEYNGQTIWVDGDITLEGTIGTRENPVVMVVDGNVTARGQFDEFHGVLYVKEELVATGNPEFYGAAIIERNTTILNEADPDFIAGNPKFIFDPVAAGGASNVGRRGAVTGSWRDWLSQ